MPRPMASSGLAYNKKTPRAARVVEIIATHAKCQQGSATTGQCFNLALPRSSPIELQPESRGHMLNKQVVQIARLFRTRECVATPSLPKNKIDKLVPGKQMLQLVLKSTMSRRKVRPLSETLPEKGIAFEMTQDRAI